MANSIPNFRVGLQLSDHGGTSQFGEERLSNWAKDENIWSEWATDANQYDPDAVRVHLEVEQTNFLTDRDFRLVVQGSDQGGTADFGGKQFTPWASEGGGWTGLVSDANAYDPDAFRIKIETRPWQSIRTIKDMRLGIQLFDQGGREAGDIISSTRWASQGGGWSEWAFDNNQYDPDGLKIKLEVRFD